VLSLRDKTIRPSKRLNIILALMLMGLKPRAEALSPLEQEPAQFVDVDSPNNVTSHPFRALRFLRAMPSSASLFAVVRCVKKVNLIGKSANSLPVVRDL
jgi:hypothetical protein